MKKRISMLARVVFGAVGAGLLFYLIQPLWLATYWWLQGYPPTIRDFSLWYQVGVFNAIPTAGVLLNTLPVYALLEGFAARRAVSRNQYSLYSGGLTFACLPIAANLLLVVYASMMPYWTPDAALNSILKGYLGYFAVAPAAGLAASLVGMILWSIGTK